MSEPIWCSVTFKVPAAWGDPPQFVVDAQEALINGYGPDENTPEGETRFKIWRVEGEGNYGLNDDDLASVLQWCRDNHVPFHAQDDPKYEFDGSIELFDGERSHLRSGADSGEIHLTHGEWLGWKQTHSGMALLSKVEHYFTLPSLDDIDIQHLLGAPMPDYDGEEVNA